MPLSGVLIYHFFDASYEGDWMEVPSIDTPLSEKETAEIESAVATAAKWKLSPEDEWVRQNLIEILTGKKDYTGLPHP